IAYGDLAASDDQVIAAARAACADDFVRQLPQGYETWIGERGVKLSIGQKQRLAIARAFLKNPPIIIFDEGTSSVVRGAKRFVSPSWMLPSVSASTLKPRGASRR